MSLRRVLPSVLAVVFASSGLAACGGGGSGSGAGGSPAGGPTAAQVLLKRTAAALRRIHSYRASGVSVDRDGRGTLLADVSDDGRLRTTSRSTRDGTLSLIIIGTATYARGDRRYWLRGGGAQGQAAADAFAGRWVKTPPSFGTPLLKTVKQLQPKTLAHCLPQDLGTLSLESRTVPDQGRRARIIRDDGAVPGGTEAELWVAAKGQPLPLRELTHGATRKGGTFDPLCDDPDDTTTRSSYRFSRYDAIPPIKAPRHPLDLGRLHGAAPGGRSV
ncbi:MAG: hypothetical protein JWM31_2693 [Solirubrobacterales bacterium]|nr:hypothetical protein [Solirubrobacterales bacterium]